MNNKLKLAFIMGMVNVLIIGLIVFVVRVQLNFSNPITYIVCSAVSFFSTMLCYSIAINGIKKKKDVESKKLPSIKSVKNELKNMSKNKLVKICISLQSDLLKLEKKGVK